jgi:hypothetical protein
MDMKLPIKLIDEVGDDVITSQALLNLASGEISDVRYDDYNVDEEGMPWDQDDYDITSGVLSKGGKDVEFTVQVDKAGGTYSVSPTELAEIKLRAAALFSGSQVEGLAHQPIKTVKVAASAPSRGVKRRG